MHVHSARYTQCIHVSSRDTPSLPGILLLVHPECMLFSSRQRSGVPKLYLRWAVIFQWWVMNCLWVMIELCYLLDFIFSHSYSLHTFIFKLIVRNLKQVCVGVGVTLQFTHTHTPKIMFLFCWSLFLLFLSLNSFTQFQVHSEIWFTSCCLIWFAHPLPCTHTHMCAIHSHTHNSPCHCVYLSVYLSPIYTHTHTHYVSACSLRMYSPMSAWWNTTGVMGSVCRQPSVDLAATPKPCSTNITSSLDGDMRPTTHSNTNILCSGQGAILQGRCALTDWWLVEYWVQVTEVKVV